MLTVITTVKDAIVGRFSRSGKDEGATAVEYGLMVALIAGVIIAAVTLLGGQVNKGFEKTCAGIQNAGTTVTATPAPTKCS